MTFLFIQFLPTGSREEPNFSAILTAYPVNILCTGRERRYVKLTKETARDNAALPGVQPATLMQSGDFASQRNPHPDSYTIGCLVGHFCHKIYGE